MPENLGLVQNICCGRKDTSKVDEEENSDRHSNCHPGYIMSYDGSGNAEASPHCVKLTRVKHCVGAPIVFRKSHMTDIATVSNWVPAKRITHLLKWVKGWYTPKTGHPIPRKTILCMRNEECTDVYIEEIRVHGTTHGLSSSVQDSAVYVHLKEERQPLEDQNVVIVD